MQLSTPTASNHTDVSIHTNSFTRPAATDAGRMVELYLASVNLSPSTRTLRRRLLRRVPGLLDASTDDLLIWIGGHSWKPGTRATNESTLRCFYRWLRRRGYRSDNPTEDLPRVKVPAASPRPAPEELIDQALLSASDRTRLMVALGAWAGLRRAEIASLRWGDVVGQRLDVTGKGGVRRQVWISPELTALLEAEQRRRVTGQWGTGWRTEIDPESPYIFPGRSGGHLATISVWRSVRAVLGIWPPHSLRHRYASQLYRHTGHDLIGVQGQLGHASVATTQRYVGIDPTDLLPAITALSRTSKPEGKV